jgi:hypothetical protein
MLRDQMLAPQNRQSSSIPSHRFADGAHGASVNQFTFGGNRRVWSRETERVESAAAPRIARFLDLSALDAVDFDAQVAAADITDQDDQADQPGQAFTKSPFDSLGLGGVAQIDLEQGRVDSA